MTLIKGFFFDLDGTLVDTHDANYFAYKRAIRHVRGITINDTLKARIKAGESSDQFLRALMPGISDEDVSAINLKKKEIYPSQVHRSIKNDYLVKFLSSLSGGDNITFLVTTAKRGNAETVLRHHDLEKHFTHMIFGDEISNLKPHPEVYLIALERSGLKPDEVIAFEDSKAGIRSAESAGIRTIHIKDFI